MTHKEMAEIIYKLALDMDHADYEETAGETIDALDDAIWHLSYASRANFRTLYAAIARIAEDHEDLLTW